LLQPVEAVKLALVQLLPKKAVADGVPLQVPGEVMGHEQEQVSMLSSKPV
jgi:hypothetical protein